ncbi:flagellar biosynthetic protein FliO [Heyndrickxia ginsengihumi]|uniref:flagellar biosynthetic protein FliO n=1 Tax=Heyndrickxia ginsengihumi TaxID=363870 RepID=UPI00046EAC01|nr:flagellar biosynthetic protein FliO [Heyndrickxia ginsengihumi]MCM3022505.1 flagellar biosynthetic protein FliO [Heyndrickxia ginsengihumi]
MRNLAIKWMSILAVLLYIMYGHFPVENAHAASFNGSVQECIDHPKKCDSSSTSDSKQKKSPSSTSTSSVVSAWDIIKMVFALIFVIALLYCLLKFINKKSRSYQNNRLIQNFGGTPLGGNKSLQMVKVGNRLLVIGVGEDIHLVKEIDDKDEVTALMNQYNQQLEQSLEPRDIITKLTNTIKTHVKKDEQGRSSSFKHLLVNQLDALKKERKTVMKEMEQMENKHDE